VFSAGPVTVTAKTGAQPATTTFPIFTSTNLIAFYGAQFTSVVTNLTPSLDATFITFGRGGEVWTMDTQGNNLAEVSSTSPVGSPSPAVNALGRIVYDQYDPSVNKPQIFVTNADGSGNYRLSDGSQVDQFSAWTNDNGSVLFTRYVSPHFQIFKMSSSGASPTNLDDGTADDSYPTQSSNGLIAFARANSTTGHQEIWVMSANGSNKHVVLSSPTAGLQQPAISLDGTRILYQVVDGTTPTYIGLTYLQSPGVIQLTTPANAVDSAPSWSPDGKTILFVRITAATSYQIMHATFDGKDVAAFYSSVDTLAHPAWSPFPARKAFIYPAGAPFGNKSDGFIVAQRGGAIASFLTALSSTNAVTIAPDSAGTTLVQRITVGGGGTLTSLLYANSQWAAPITVPVAGAKSAVVTYRTDGTVSLIVPAVFKASSQANAGKLLSAKK